MGESMLSPIVAGDTLKLDYYNSDYTSADYDIEIRLRGNDLEPIDIIQGSTGITIGRDGDGWAVTVDASATADYSAGIYLYVIHLTDGTERYEVERGTVEVKADIATMASTDDPRSHVKKVLDAIEAVIEGRASNDELSYSIAGRSLSLTPIPDLLVLRDKYKWEYDREIRAQKIANGLKPGGQVRVRL
jgi:hypothetical protein